MAADGKIFYYRPPQHDAEVVRQAETRRRRVEMSSAARQQYPRGLPLWFSLVSSLEFSLRRFDR